MVLKKTPKKMGVNIKAEEARGRKAAAEAEKKERERREKDEKFWSEAEGQKSKAAKKKEEDAERRAEAAAKRIEAKKLAEQETAEIEKSLKKVPKVTAAELARYKEEEAKEVQATVQAVKKREARTVEEEEYEKLVVIENTNRDDTLVDAHDIQSALAQFIVTDTTLDRHPERRVTTHDRHPERRVKASYKAFEEAELPRLKKEKPRMTHTQYKDAVWKLWKKSPDNPLNQAGHD